MLVATLMFGATCVAVVLFRLEPSIASSDAKDVPPVVTRLALRYELFHLNLPKSFPRDRNSSHDRTLQQEYAFWFLQGYIYPAGSWSRSTNGGSVDLAAAAAADAYKADHPDEADAIMSAYGYRRVEVEGVWRRASEESTFVPNGQPSEAWWLKGFQEFDPYELHSPFEREVAVDNGPFKRVVAVRIVGYLSPLGSYGHLGASTRQVLVSSMSDSKL